MVNILLASNSARRRELIRLTGWDVVSTAADINEDPLPGEFPRDHVLRLAREKAEVILSRHSDQFVLTADTIVVDQDAIIGKPKDASDAFQILRSLRNHDHSVMTAIALYDVKKGQLLTDLCESRVPMRDYSDQEINDYILSGDPMDKAGAYAIQNREFHPVMNFDGCFASVMGMPLCHLERLARKAGLNVEPGLQTRCQAKLCYQCSVYSAILQGDIISYP